MNREAPIVFGITGASGAPYAIRLLEQLVLNGKKISLIISSYGLRLLSTEADVASVADLRDRVGATPWDKLVTVYANDDRGAVPASGSSVTDGMVICPCSMGTLSAISVGASRSLIERAADITLKERRKLIVVPRETPLSAIHLGNMLRLARAGAVVMPASPGFYNRPRKIEDAVDFIVARVLDHLDVEHKLGKRWTGKA